MADSLVGYVIEYLTSDEDSTRDLALAWLCEGYMNEPQIAHAVFTQWDNRSPESAYATFPMLSYFPVHRSQVIEACARAQAMALAGAELTSLTTRCAGKLLEQVVRLPAEDLRPHLDAITEAAQSNKIFFRVDLANLRNRIELLDRSADELAGLLNEAVEALVADQNNAPMIHQARQALETLRLKHPSYMDLANVLKQGSSEPAAEISQQLVLGSLAEHPGQDWLEEDTAALLQDPRESIVAATIEALVHRGTGMSAQVLVDQFPAANETNRRWIARGLQRMRVHGLAPLIAQLREKISDHSLWMMLLVAELQQLDPDSSIRAAEAFEDLSLLSQALIDAGTLYTFVCGPLQTQLPTNELELKFRELLMRAQKSQAASRAAEERDGLPTRDMRSVRRTQSKQIDKLFNKRRK